MATDAGSLLEAVKAANYDRYLAALYTPADKRRAILSLYAFDAEIAGIRDRISQALPGEIRLQWWRDVIASANEGAGGGHPVAEALLETIRVHRLPQSAFDNYLEARIFDLYDDPMPSRTDLEGYCGETTGAIIQMTSMVLDPAAAPAHAELAGWAGCGLAITGLLRLLPRHRSRGQCFIPRDMLAAAGTDSASFLADPETSASVRAVEMMVAVANEHLTAFKKGATKLPTKLRPAFLPLALTAAYLGQMKGREAALSGRGTDVSPIRKHWLMLWCAARGWS